MIAERLKELGREPKELDQSGDDEDLEDIELECKERLALLEEEKLLKVCVKADTTLHFPSAS